MLNEQKISDKMEGLFNRAMYPIKHVYRLGVGKVQAVWLKWFPAKEKAQVFTGKFPKSIECEKCGGVAKRKHEIWAFDYNGKKYHSSMWFYKCDNPICKSAYTTDESRKRTASTLMKTVNGHSKVQPIR